MKRSGIIEEYLSKRAMFLGKYEKIKSLYKLSAV